MPYTVKLPPIRCADRAQAEGPGASPIPSPAVTLVTSGDSGRSGANLTSRGTLVPDVGPLAEALPFLAMSLDEFQARGALLEVGARWLPVTLWMVPAERDVEALMAEGISRGRIWTAAELAALMSLENRSPDAVRTLAHAKFELDGEITEVRRR